VTPEKRLQKALEKIEACKQQLFEHGVTESSWFDYAIKNLFFAFFQY